LEEEIREIVEGLEKSRVRRPYYAVLGGAKVAGKGGKLKAIRGLLDSAERIVIGGAMLYPFLRVKHSHVGEDPLGRKGPEVAEDIAAARKLLKEAGGRICLPTTVCGLVGGREEDFDLEQEECPAKFRIQDVRQDGLRALFDGLAAPATVVWNGPLGRFEDARFRDGTTALLEYLVKVGRRYRTRTVVGGGETEATISTCCPRAAAALSHVSTGGGAMLAALAGQPLPGIEVLDDAK
jgi:phosphoglycerate kinase